MAKSTRFGVAKLDGHAFLSAAGVMRVEEVPEALTLRKVALAGSAAGRCSGALSVAKFELRVVASRLETVAKSARGEMASVRSSDDDLIDFATLLLLEEAA